MWNTRFAMRLPQTQRLLATRIHILVIVMVMPLRVFRAIAVILFHLPFEIIVHSLKSFRRFHRMLKELFEGLIQ